MVNYRASSEPEIDFGPPKRDKASVHPEINPEQDKASEHLEVNPERDKLMLHPEGNPDFLKAKVPAQPEIDFGPPEQNKASVHPEVDPGPPERDKLPPPPGQDLIAGLVDFFSLCK